MTGWECPQAGCALPLERHIVSLAAMNRPPEPKPTPKKVRRNG